MTCACGSSRKHICKEKDLDWDFAVIWSVFILVVLLPPCFIALYR